MPNQPINGIIAWNSPKKKAILKFIDFLLFTVDSLLFTDDLLASPESLAE